MLTGQTTQPLFLACRLCLALCLPALGCALPIRADSPPAAVPIASDSAAVHHLAQAADHGSGFLADTETTQLGDLWALAPHADSASRRFTSPPMARSGVQRVSLALLFGQSSYNSAWAPVDDVSMLGLEFEGHDKDGFGWEWGLSGGSEDGSFAGEHTFDKLLLKLDSDYDRVSAMLGFRF